ncbi:MAG: motility associated factor glycosyltransferase family protein [Alkalimonas sp.]|nr:motility associated factor glycosyltransferase family protein [Alkalimonas sp.]
MLKYINYQLQDDSELQEQLERNAASQINKTLSANMAAFRHYIPSVIEIVEQNQVQQYSLFCNKHEALNIVDFATGRVLYGEHPKEEIRQEVASFLLSAPYFEIEGSSTDEDRWLTEPVPASIETLIMFGMGFGYQLTELLQQVRIKYLIVYEPSVDMLFCSLQAHDWLELFELAAALNTQIFLQLGNDGSSLPADLAELSAVTTQSKCYLYRHYFHPVMDKVINFAQQNSGNAAVLTSSQQHFMPYDHLYDFISERNPNVLGNSLPDAATLDDALYQRNMAALAQYYPKVHQAIEQHQAKQWQLVKVHEQVNLYHSERRALFYQDTEAESTALVDYFVHHPFKDDIILGQKVSGKLKHYIHFTHVSQVEPLINRQLSQQTVLPDEVGSLIVFGVGLGRHIEQLVKQRHIKNLYICEPNLDFFAASLWVTDWAGILSEADEAESRIYLNLGGDGSSYFYDLMAQFYQVGAYSIADTYMLSSYFNPRMQQAISDLRAELKVVLALGEYFDHARYGVAHTYNSLKQKHNWLKYDNRSYKQLPAMELPVFVVGNGPSLDDSIDTLKQYQGRAIIISCGTALRSLHKHGIQPDFHAEVEQNRATYFWVNQVDDPDYLKGINLLSVNGIHPDTASLFKDVFLCFKDGESSTFWFQKGLEKRGVKIASLSYAYPTVTNLVMNYILRLGSKVIYLFGVDLGFIDVRYHHSKSSAYYRDDGSEIYDYQKAHGGGIPAAGNFIPWVFTKREFDVSRKLMEQAISKAGRKVEVYNCSNGVAIKGAVPLHQENILLDNQLGEKEGALKELLDKAFYQVDPTFADDIYTEIDLEAFETTLSEWFELFEVEVIDRESAQQFVETQWKLLRESTSNSKDPTFTLLYGSTNYFGGVLTKLVSSISDEHSDVLDIFNRVRELWCRYLKQAYHEYITEPLKFDDVNVQVLFKPRA